MIIGLSGTPGTGKTTVSKLLKGAGFVVMDINEIAKKQHLLKSFDENRQTYEIDLKGVNNFIKKRYNEMKISEESKPLILDGHVAHLLKILNKVIVLRCHPEELKSRLSNKNWPPNKIHENMEAEALDVIIIEALEKYGEDITFEIDTTNIKPQKIVDKIIKIIGGDTQDFKPGNIDWSEEILKWY
jgi:adenylate kinase